MNPSYADIQALAVGAWLKPGKATPILCEFGKVSKPVELSWTEDGDVENPWDEPHM